MVLFRGTNIQKKLRAAAYKTENFPILTRKDSKKRALTYVFPIHPACVDMLLNEKPNPKQSPWWRMVWDKVRIPEDHSHYKTVINKETYIC